MTGPLGCTFNALQLVLIKSAIYKLRSERKFKSKSALLLSLFRDFRDQDTLAIRQAIVDQEIEGLPSRRFAENGSDNVGWSIICSDGDKLTTP
jgi:hypothetical protein